MHYKGKNMNQEVLNNSIIIVGPVGVGKSLISSKLGERSGLPVITTDLMRHCPKDSEEIDRRQADVEGRIGVVEKKLDSFFTKFASSKKEKLMQELDFLKNESWVCDRQREMRKLLPNVSSYEDMGFRGHISHYMEDNFGKVGWHFYQKQFENQLLSEIIEQLSTPAIIDMGGGMAISLDDEYSKIAEGLQEKDSVVLRKYIDMDKVGFSHIADSLSHCPNVVELRLPDNYRETMARASRDELNEKFISSGQFGQVSTRHIATDGLITGVSYDEVRLNDILEQVDQEREKE